MAETSGLPSWLVPPVSAFRDLVALSLFNMRQGWEAEYCTGIMAAAGWVQGQYPAPVTSDMTGNGPDPDVLDPYTVEAESWAAGLAGDPDGGLDMTEVCRVLDVPLRIPLQVPPGYAAGVYAGLRWMLGMDRKPPMPLPWRGPDGLPANACYIYAQLLAAAGPVDESARAALQAEAERLAKESWTLAKRGGQQRSRNGTRD